MMMKGTHFLCWSHFVILVMNPCIESLKPFRLPLDLFNIPSFYVKTNIVITKANRLFDDEGAKL